jgi:colanic acid/amylovoran biosynthesis glycosyltransferase
VTERRERATGADQTRPRVLVLTTTFPARPGDGTPEFVLSLARALADSFDITVLAPRMGSTARTEVIDGVFVRRFPYFPKRWEGLAAGAILPNLRATKRRWAEVPALVGSLWWHALRLTRSWRPDVVHAHWILPSGLVAWSLRSLLGVPYVLTIHGADAYALRSRALRALKRRVIRRASLATPVSRDIAVSLGLEEDLVVPMGVDFEGMSRAVGERDPVPGRLLFVGRLVEKKGVDVLLRSLARVRDASLVVVGDGPDRASLESLTRELGMAPRVSFLGNLGHEEVVRELRRAQALVIPSRVARDGDQEGTPVVMAEAFAAGIPLVASRLGGMAEHVVSGRTGLLVEPESPESLAHALQQVIEAPETLTHLAERARAEGAALDLRFTSERYRSFLENGIRSSRRS